MSERGRKVPPSAEETGEAGRRGEKTAALVRRLLPLAAQLKGYTLGHLRRDAVAGLTVALVLIPQSMAYAQLAGLPSYYGLYSALLPPVVASFFGSSRQLASGPAAVVSLLTAVALEPLARAGSPGFIAYAVVLSLLVGLFQAALGVLRLGLVVNFLSHPVVSGFTNAAALIIASSQLAKIFGVEVEKADYHFATVARVVSAAWQDPHWPTVGMAVLAFAIMYGLRRLSPRLPYVLAAVAVTTALSWATGFHQERRLAVERLSAPPLVAKIAAYNQALEDATRRVAARNRLDAQTRQATDPAQALELGYRADQQNLAAEEDKRLASLLRDEMRQARLTARPGPAGEVFAAATAEASESQVWRLAVGQGPLPADRLPLTSGGAVVGMVPAGLPPLVWPEVQLATLPRLVPLAAIIALLGFMEAVSIAKAMAAKTGQRLDPNQELIGQGLANLVGAFSQGYPVSGSFGRSAVNLQAGAQTGLASLFASLTVAVVLLFFTPALYYLPQPVLAAIIMMAVLGLLNPSGLIHTWKAQRHDGIISVITFLATLAFAPHLDRGIILGVTCSILVFLYKSMRPTVATLAVAPDHSLHDVAIHHLAQCRHIAVIRFDGPLFFANASFLEDRIIERRKSLPELRHVIIVADGMSELDATGEETLSLLVDRLRSSGQKISFAGVHYKVRETMERTHLWAKIGAENFYPTAAEAVAAVHADAHRHSTEDVCPLLSYCPVDGAGEAPEVSHVRG
ncbi:MAG: SulP family inorganic anion transporter [Deltaproteobacteria bacterium]|nr:SulP family inorganic anion transporter [Deltaproteobacteria bacterium]